jgi:regulator of PEP synthase PpsR (kinase-PPPase family)
MNKFPLYLISDSTGDTVYSVAKAALAQFQNVEAEEYLYTLVRTDKQMEKILAKIRKRPGIVMYTIVEKELRTQLKTECRELHIPCISVLSRVITDISAYLNVKAESNVVGKQHELDKEYFERMNAINFAIAHDDGQSTWDLEEADIIIIGPSRTSKSPTSLYLAFKGYKTANIPYVQNCILPENLFKINTPLIVGLTINVENLIQIRKSRLLSLYEDQTSCYVETEAVEEEIKESRKLFMKNDWPIIDVTKRSVEETSATIIQYYNKKNGWSK